MSHLLLCLICFHETLPSKNSLHLLVKCILKMENVFGSGGLMVQVAKIFAIQYFFLISNPGCSFLDHVFLRDNHKRFRYVGISNESNLSFSIYQCWLVCTSSCWKRFIENLKMLHCKRSSYLIFGTFFVYGFSLL